jgi:hypothetical protein
MVSRTADHRTGAQWYRMAKQKHYRGFTYHYDLGSVKVARPIPKALGKAARVWLDYLGLAQMQLMLIGHEAHDPLSSGSGSLLFKGEEMLPPGDRKRLISRDFDCICVVIENDDEGRLFKKRDRLERIVLRELVYIARPETRGNPESSLKIIEDILAQTGR